MFSNDDDLVFLTKEEKINKTKDGTYTLITLGDPLLMENYTFFADDNIDTSRMSRGDKVSVVIKLVKRGFNINPQLSALTLSEV